MAPRVSRTIPRWSSPSNSFRFEDSASLVSKVYLLDQALSDRERVENRGFPIRIANSLSDKAEPHAKDCRLRITPPAQPVQSLARVQRHKGEFEQPQKPKVSARIYA
jgi:hypothetical protein